MWALNLNSSRVTGTISFLWGRDWGQILFSLEKGGDTFFDSSLFFPLRYKFSLIGQTSFGIGKLGGQTLLIFKNGGQTLFLVFEKRGQILFRLLKRGDKQLF